ncbi:hypothetical protein LSH36_807g00138 [Paralvinella palmiformis]|uniref:C2 domain-containing protein n=1 Tax=Paralvinella palmiformis TaxID=53620 RepID=A0AAD9MSJ2_9ANNE|nr:hypothetical protein LSH36_807g00138 [Paralvinella palmiformis]
MPGKVKVQIVAGRDLPVMDRANNSTDAFVEIKFASATFKTDVCRRSLNPQWNSEWYRFEVDDEDLQDEMLQIRVFDHDTYSAHDAIGKVYIDLNPLLMKDRAHSISGWFPVYDTMHGIRGELNVVVKLELFTDFNKFRQSSCGVKFFYTSGVPCGYSVRAIHGFVEELVVNDDPEYDWINKIRSMRASNEARQIQFSKLSGELQRKIGIKVLEMCGNAVIGYRQCIDLEGESGVVVRGIGTSVTLQKYSAFNLTPPITVSPGKDMLLSEEGTSPHSPNYIITSGRRSYSPACNLLSPGRRSSDSDTGTPPKADSLHGSSSSGGGGGGVFSASRVPVCRSVMEQETIDMMDYPFFTIKSFPPGFLVHLGGVVSARSVKLLDKIHNPDEPETRDAWWTELRTEIRCHARTMGCHAVVGYCEETTISDELIILSACGTAAIVNLYLRTLPAPLNLSFERQQFDKKLHVDVNLANQASAEPGHQCRRCNVPDILFTTIELPVELPIVGKGCLIQARVFRQKKDGKGEANAKEISESLPFMEIELHSQLANKLKVKGMNSLYGLKIQFSVGECLIVAIATATAVFSAPIPAPRIPKAIRKSISSSSANAVPDVQQKLLDTIYHNKKIYGLLDSDLPVEEYVSQNEQPPDDVDELTSNAGIAKDVGVSKEKDLFVLEVDDTDDFQALSVLLDPLTPEGFDLCNTETVPGFNNIVTNLQMFTQVWRDQLKPDQLSSMKSIAVLFDSMMRSLCFKLRSMVPCALCHLNFDVEIPEEDEIQITINGMCVSLAEPVNISRHHNPSQSSAAHQEKQNKVSGQSDGEDLMFQMEMGTQDGFNTSTRHTDLIKGIKGLALSDGYWKLIS